MRRRLFIAGLGSAVAWPVVAWAQQPAMPVIGLLTLGPRSAPQAPFLRAFRKGLGESGYVEGRNVMIDYQSAENDHVDQLPAMALELVRRRVAVIVTVGGVLAALAAKTASATIPIVFRYGGDPVADGLVASLNRPGGNVTGVTGLSTELTGKRFELLHEMVPAARSIGFLINPSTLTGAAFRKAAADRASTIFGTQLEFLTGGSPNEIEAAFATLNQKRITALVVQNSPFFFTQFGQLGGLAARYAVPAIYHVREAVDAGGLMSYGPSFADDMRLLEVYAGRILKGEKPAELPVQQSTKVELVINHKTARTLGLIVPETLLATADEVIE
jgi:putative tryptophan/tyrosine transport system substrate-binding protein